MGDTRSTKPVTQVLSGGCLEWRRVHCEWANVCVSLSLTSWVGKSFKRPPTATEWGRFRKYARRMRELRAYCTPCVLSLEVLSVLQTRTVNEPLLPNLKALHLWGVDGPLFPFVPLFLSPRTTFIFFRFNDPDLPKAMAASIVTTFPRLCPDLQAINIQLPTDPMITAAVSEMVLTTNRNALQKFVVDCPLTDEAREVVYTLPNLHDLSVAIEKETSLPSASLPNLTKITIKCEDEGDWPRLFHGASLGKLESVTFYPQSEEEIGDFLGAFERAALSSSLQNTLSKFHVRPLCSWNPNYSPLLPFTQLVELTIGSRCGVDCSSRVDDDIIIDLSRAMPKLKILELGYDPCRESTMGVTANGLLALALHCPNLLSLSIHFQVAGLITLPARPGIGPDAGPTGSWTDCALTNLTVGRIPMPEESVLMAASALLRIFPRIENIFSTEGEWGEVEEIIQTNSRFFK